ncbi:sulfatase-like hydrolase/transferase [Polaribacter ponticola]|uniref:Sulfatase-like hydrolase/transferase n=1 Tax=Polaribacter ponticola TaxID=2978475 RepID=A0ABT5SB49_9FLAO|nr:sulfatase-like hydrolase/transferase [Polaribacter sp. MSW5]MDD7915340.1 sulfatase-like hydrolase/transferase [Polaribacter sp. MSW5]
MLADDFGYGELGVYGQTKIETPNIDALAKNGMLFTQY